MMKSKMMKSTNYEKVCVRERERERGKAAKRDRERVQTATDRGRGILEEYFEDSLLRTTEKDKAQCSTPQKA